MDNQNNFAAEELRSCLYNPNNWDNPVDQNDIFESALSSMVSSPVTSNGGGGGENIVLRELIGRLGSICNSGEMPPDSYNINGDNNNNNSTNSCYSTPLNSPPKLNLSIMDHQIRGNLPISASHLAPHHQGFVAPFPSDPGFAERAARYSCFATKNLSGQIGMNNDADFVQRLVPKLDSGKISRVSSNHSIKIPGSLLDVQDRDGFSKAENLVSDKKWSKFSRSSTPENSEFGDSMEISSLTEQITAGKDFMNALSEANPRKRKPMPKGKAKEPTSLNSAKDANVAAENSNINAKRSKSEEDNTEEKDGTKEEAESYGTDKSAGDGNKKQSKNSNAKPPEPPKDYIHVRARRGQATDAHSLAERVRREKISERMKLLQDLVPGCNKVTGKAVMLDEIINYVQSLQRQVEFLSMKLGTIHPRSDFNAEALLSKDDVQSQGPLHNNIYQSAASTTEFPYPLYQLQGTNAQHAVPNGAEMLYTMNHLNGSTGRNAGMQLLPSDNFREVPPQVQGFWGDDLHSVVQMGVCPNQAQDFHGQ